ncbi:MchS3 family protein [Dryocola clanedunensis]
MKGILRGLAASLFSAVAFSSSGVADTTVLSPAEQLAKVQVFSLGFNGFVGHISEGERLMKTIAAQGNAREIFMNIASSPASSPEAKLYAACALEKAGYSVPDALFATQYATDVSMLRADILSKQNFKATLLALKNSVCRSGHAD